MPRRSRTSWHVETLEPNPRDPLVWLGQYAAADQRVDGEVVKELHRQLVSLGYAVVRTEVLPAGTLLATLTLADGAAYRLVQLAMAEAQRLLNAQGTPPGRSPP